ncbi:uncharacterized protein LOC6565366 [Drosophila grimshawi]|uniref:RING-type E3 ubiquitin transferase n=1 Tax=Drosophila grimshawi TaxID=7222 RepID=B4JL29_DROGR|nr:uncharacterized protein LOC6565366 [Drosophila grimshawi]EDW00282.1 GH12778 [Drosophila grimshawi]
MSSADQDTTVITASNGHAQENGKSNTNSSSNSSASNSAASTTTTTTTETTTTTSSGIRDNTEQLQIMGQLKTIEHINEQRRIFLKSTINEIKEENSNEMEANADADADGETVKPLGKLAPPKSLPLNVKYATLPSIITSATVTSPTSPPPKPPMLSRTRSTGSGDGRTPLTNGDSTLLLRSNIVTDTNKAPATTTTTTAAAAADKATTTTTTITTTESTDQVQQPAATVSAKHYESLIEELRCPGCAGPMKAPVLLCKSGHSICEQCTRILLMCPLCKEGFTNSRSLTIEALCAKAHFGCSHAAGGCAVRMPVALLPWHEQQCIYKPMKCFMGRVWGDCKWHGREVQWKQHLEEEHTDKLFQSNTADLEWNMGVRRKPLTGYYVFEAHDELFNFYEIYEKQQVLFTMTCTSNRRESKYKYAYEVTLLQPDNEALLLTQKFPVHSEYDRDILMDGTCVNISLSELARFVTDDKMLHYRVTVTAVNSPRRLKPSRQSLPALPLDYQQVRNVPMGTNGKSVPASMIITRTYKEAIGEVSASSSSVTATTPDSEEGNVLELERKWGTPQLHFNRKYLRNALGEDASSNAELKVDELRPLHETRSSASANEDKLSLCSNSTSYTKKVSDTLRRSFRALRSDLVEMRPFAKKKSTAKKPVATAAAETTNTAC